MNYKNRLAIGIAKALESCDDAPTFEKLIEIPPSGEMGDYAFPCFSLSKKLRRSPAVIASGIKDKLNEDKDIIDITSNICVAGGYLNFFLRKDIIIKDIVTEVIQKGDEYGSSLDGQGKTVLVEFSSPNIAKPFHIGHLVSTALGSSLERVYKKLGYNTVKINHLGDWGTQFGKLICAYKRWGDYDVIKENPIHELMIIYVKFHDESKIHPELEDEARMYFKLLEDGDEEVTKLWRMFVDLSLKEFNRMYDMLGISFDSFAGESFYSDKMSEIVQMLKDKNLLEESEGAMVVRFEDEKLPPSIIIKSDGTTIYATRDIAAAVYRKRHYDFYKNIYIVGTPQTLHFQQVFAVIKKLGFDWADDCVHVGFAHVHFPDRNMSTRSGDVVLLEDVIRESIQKTRSVIESSATSKDVDNIDEACEKIGIGAILYAFLKNGRERDIIFTWKDMLDFEGESGPYVQYAYARGKSILRKSAEIGICYSVDDDVYTENISDEEYSLIKKVNAFNDSVKEAVFKNEPCCVNRYVTDLAQLFNRFYNSCTIMKAEDSVRRRRLLITEAVCICIRSALHILGIEVVEKM